MFFKILQLQKKMKMSKMRKICIILTVTDIFQNSCDVI